MDKEKTIKITSIINIAVIVAALGYFVDIYDLILFSIVRIKSLTELGLSGQDLLDKGLLLLNVQMAGMLTGGVLFGILGDKKGRLTLLFGSICVYSIANIANGFVNDFYIFDAIQVYAVLRFIAGVGLAGELGGGITLVSEIMTKESRGYGTMIVASLGVAGAVLAYYVTELFHWRTSYFIGGGLGIFLLFLRIAVFESGMFEKIKEKKVTKGNFFSLFTSRERFVKYIKCILIGVPSWYCTGILISFSPEFAKILNIQGEISVGKAVMLFYLGLVPGDFISGLISQLLKSRKKAVLIFLIITSLLIGAYFLSHNANVTIFYTICFSLGFAIGYWAVFVTIATEQFGTNLRATVTTSVPNIVRASIIPISFVFAIIKPCMGIYNSGILVGLICMLISFIALFRLEETFGKDLDYVEE